MQKVSDPFDFRVRNVKSRTTAKVSIFVRHIVNKQSNHPKTKALHFYFYNTVDIYKGVIICEKLP